MSDMAKKDLDAITETALFAEGVCDDVPAAICICAASLLAAKNGVPLDELVDLLRHNHRMFTEVEAGMRRGEMAGLQ